MTAFTAVAHEPATSGWAVANYGTKAWPGLAVAAELLAPDDQLLSDQARGWVMRAPLGRVLCVWAVAEVGGHLLRILSPFTDVHHQLGQLFLRLTDSNYRER